MPVDRPPAVEEHLCWATEIIANSPFGDGSFSVGYPIDPSFALCSSCLNHMILLCLADLVHCPPFGKKHDDCMALRHSSSGGDSSSSGGDGDGDDGSSSSSVESKSSEGTAATDSSLGTTNGSVQVIRLAMWIAAAAAICLAIGALYLGQRRSYDKQHSLSGSVARRMNLFGALCSVAAFRCVRPPRHATTTEPKTPTSDAYEIMAGGDGGQQGEAVLPLQQTASV
jgi:hypothetical protein